MILSNIIKEARWSHLLCSAGLICLCSAIFAGNRIIATGHIMIVIAAILWLVNLRSGKDHDFSANIKSVRLSSVALMVLIAAMIVSVLVNWDTYPNPWRDLKKIRYEILMLILYLIPFFRIHASRSLTTQRLCFWATLTLGVTVSSVGVYGALTLGHPFVEKTTDLNRASGISGTVMSFAYSIQFLALLALAFFFAPQKSRDYILRYCSQPILIKASISLFLIACLSGLIMSQSRGALLGFGAGSLALFIIAKAKWIWIPVCIALVASVFIAQQQNSRILRPLSEESVRIGQWKTATLTFLSNPVFGVGHRQFEKQSAELKRKFNLPKERQWSKKGWVRKHFKGHAHNNYLEAFASTGIIGGLSFLAFCFFWMQEVTRSTNARIFFLPVVIAFMVSGFFENTFTDSEVLNTIMILYFLSQLILDQERSQPTLEGSTA